MVWSDLLGWPKISFVFFYKMAVVVLSCLSSNETILLDYIVTAAISVCIKKKTLSKLMNFCVAILISKVEENIQHFWHVMLYYFKKGKNTTETRCVQCKEKVL